MEHTQKRSPGIWSAFRTIAPCSMYGGSWATTRARSPFTPSMPTLESPRRRRGRFVTSASRGEIVYVVMELFCEKCVPEDEGRFHGQLLRWLPLKSTEIGKWSDRALDVIHCDSRTDEKKLGEISIHSHIYCHQDFNVYGRNLVAAKKNLAGADRTTAITVAVFDVLDGTILWQITHLPCRSLDRRCGQVRL